MTALIITPYLTYVGLFLGIGLLAGSIVHFPVDPLRYAFIGTIGVLLFLAGTFADELIVKKKTFKEAGLLHLAGSSAVLSIGIGMMSGSIQHFSDTPGYAALLIPIGIATSLVGYLWKHRIPVSKPLAWRLAIVLLVVCLPLGAGLRSLAHEIEPHSHTEANTH